MPVNPRSQTDRSAATSAALVSAARRLFAEHGFAHVGTEAIVQAAGVTRGALYHQFTDKAELFAAVYEQIEQDIMERLDARVSASGISDPIELMKLGAEAWLDTSTEPEVQQIVLLDGPAVLGWTRWREIGLRYGLGLVQAVLGAAIDAGRIPDQPVTPLAHVLVGALDEAALFVARAEDQAAAREQMRSVVTALVAGLEVR